jgi:hypothetical protein
MIEYFIYTVDERPVEISALKGALYEAGWSMYAIRNWYDRERLELVTDGELQDGDWTIAHRNGDPLSTDVERALADKDVRALEKWIDLSLISFATWSSEEFSLEKSGIESLDDVREQMGDMVADFFTKARGQYTVQHGIDPEFGAAGLGAVAMLRTGIVIDPQLGLVLKAPASVSEVARFIDQWSTESALAAARRVFPNPFTSSETKLSDGVKKPTSAAPGWWGWVDEGAESKRFSAGRTARLSIVIFGGYVIASLPILIIGVGVNWAVHAKQERVKKEKLDREWAETMRDVQQGKGGEAFKRLFNP